MERLTIIKARRCRKLRVRRTGSRPVKGGPGSGNFGHAGRPGEVGGSAPDGIDNVSGDSKPTVRPDKAIDKIIAFLKTGISQGDVTPFSDDPDLEGLRKALRQSMDWSVIQSRYEGGDYRGASYEKEIQRFFSLDSGVSIEELLQFQNVPPNLLLEYAATQEEIPREVWDRALSHLQGSSSPLSDAAAVLSNSEAFGRIPKEWVEKLMTPYELAHVAFWNNENSENVNEEKIVAMLKDYKVSYASAYFQIAASRIGNPSAESLMGFDNWAKLDGAGLSAHVAAYSSGMSAMSRGVDYSRMLSRWIEREKTTADDMIKALYDRRGSVPKPEIVADIVNGEQWRQVFANTKFTPEIAARFETDLGISPNDMAKEFRDQLIPHLTYTDAHGKKVGYPTKESALIDRFRSSYLDDKDPGLGIVTQSETPFIEKSGISDDAASEMKKKLSSEIGEIVRSERKGTDTEYAAPGMATYRASDFLKQWAYSSNDGDMRSLGIQEQAVEELSARLTPWQKERIDEVQNPKRKRGTNAPSDFGGDDADYDPMQRYLFQSATRDAASAKSLIRSHLRATYDLTQRELSDMGVKQALVYRGVLLSTKGLKRARVGDEIEIEENALSSWSTSRIVAERFAQGAQTGTTGIVLSTVVPAKEIYSTAVSGPGALEEEEVVVISNEKPRIAKVVSIEKR